MTTENITSLNQIVDDIVSGYGKLTASKDSIVSKINKHLDEKRELLHENAKLKDVNKKLEFENNEYKAIVSELRIYEICWKKFKPVDESSNTELHDGKVTAV